MRPLLACSLGSVSVIQIYSALRRPANTQILRGGNLCPVEAFYGRAARRFHHSAGCPCRRWWYLRATMADFPAEQAGRTRTLSRAGAQTWQIADDPAFVAQKDSKRICMETSSIAGW